MNASALACVVCGDPATNGRADRPRCDDCAYVRTRLLDALVHPAKRYEDDVAAQLFVATFPDGATLEQVSLAMGITRERVRQIEARALKHLAIKLGQLRAPDGVEDLELDALAGCSGLAPGEAVEAIRAWRHADKGTRPSRDVVPRPLRAAGARR